MKIKSLKLKEKIMESVLYKISKYIYNLAVTEQQLYDSLTGDCNHSVLISQINSNIFALGILHLEAIVDLI